jgi:hypothetical protein
LDNTFASWELRLLLIAPTDEHSMKNRAYAVGWLLLALSSCGWGQTCNTTTNWCGPYNPPSYSNVGVAAFSSTPPTASNQNTWGMTANDINTTYGAGTAHADVVPNGAVGMKQFLEYADYYVQAFDKATGYPILSTTQQGSPGPQPAVRAWNLGSGRCQPGSIDTVAAHDQVNSRWVLSNTNNTSTDGFLCIAVSQGEDLLNASGGYQSLWNEYAFDLSAIVNIHSGLPPDIADYERFGTFGSGTKGYYYITFDLINTYHAAKSYGLEGFAVCQIPQAPLLQGTAASATCYRYVVPSGQLTSHPSLIHTLLPADAESNSFATGSVGEYFLATENPVKQTSDHLAYWTWNMIVHEKAPTNILVNGFTPGCFDLGELENTFCVPEPDSTTFVDGLGDRLMSRLAYRNLPGGETLAVTQTIAASTSKRFGKTAVRYYTMLAGAHPKVQYQGQFVNSSLFYFMPSNAIDANGVVGYTFTGSLGTTYPELYLDTLSSTGVPGTATVVPGLLFTGAENGSPTDKNQFWGEYVSTTIDPADNLTFWSTGGYYQTDQIGCTLAGGWAGCDWYTAIFSCAKGGSNCP